MGKVIGSLAEIASQEVSKSGIFTLPGLCRIKTRTKPATKAGKREVFGKVVMVKAKPARKIVKAYPVKALKDSVERLWHALVLAPRLLRHRLVARGPSAEQAKKLKLVPSSPKSARSTPLYISRGCGPMR